jgi:HTH-type transcriptional repressor of NAD biosynthesis genes
MSVGMVLGKFHPLHIGHIALIEFAKKHCDELIVLVCASDKELIAGSTRLEWIQDSFKNITGIKPILLNYSEQELPNTSVSSKETSKIWATKLKARLPKIDIIFSSETYGDYLAEFMECRHLAFEPDRNTFNTSSTEISSNIFKHWSYLADSAKPYFVKRVCIYGTESTGKSTLTEKLADYFQTTFVPEMARDIINETDDCTEEQLVQIAELQARTIADKVRTANKLLFVDTDLNITSSYFMYLFGKKLMVEDWVKQANYFDLYLYLDNDVPHFQDGTRLDKQRRDDLNESHKKQLTDNNLNFELIWGNWEERLEQSISVIKKLWYV